MARRSAWPSKETYQHHCEWNNHPSPADALRVQASCGPSRGAPGSARLRTCVNRCKSCSSCCIHLLTKTTASFLPAFRFNDRWFDGAHTAQKEKWTNLRHRRKATGRRCCVEHPGLCQARSAHCIRRRHGTLECFLTLFRSHREGNGATRVGKNYAR